MTQIINPRCPACGDHLFLGTNGWLTCSDTSCPNPTLAIEVIEAEMARRSKLLYHKAEIIRLTNMDPIPKEEMK